MKYHYLILTFSYFFNNGMLLSNGASNNTQLLLEVTNDTLACFGQANGVLTVTANAGQAPFIYFWEANESIAAGGGQIGMLGGAADITGLSADTYQITITDQGGQQTILTAAVLQPAPLAVAVVTQANLLCAGSGTGELGVIGSGGTMPYVYSLDGVNFTSQHTFTNLPAGTHIITIRDVNGCTATTMANLTEPANALGGFIAQQENILCAGDSTGSVTLQGTGGIEPYLYSLDGNNFSNSNTYTQLPAGQWIATIQDANQCTVSLPVSITVPTPVMATATTTTSASSPTSTDGAALVVATGGIGNYAYFWSNGMSNDSIVNLLPNTYVVTVTDGNGCMAVDSTIVPSPDTLKLMVESNSLLCAADSNGTLTLTITGGQPPYTYAWIHAITNAADTGVVLVDGGSDTITGLVRGAYVITVQDSLGITFTTNVAIAAPPPITATLGKIDIDCFGANNGAAGIVPNGGTLPYTYIWSNGFPLQGIINLAAGDYQVTVSDANGCQYVDSTTINEPPTLLQLNMAKIDISCIGANDGQAFATVGFGVPPYTYQWDNGITAAANTLLGSGLHRVTVSDMAGCTLTDSINIIEPFLLSTSNTFVSNTSCFGSSDGQGVTVPTGGTPPYFYLWDNGETDAFADRLNAGFHTVTVTDNKGCMATDNLLIDEPDSLAAMTTQTSVRCKNGQDGSLSVVVAGGTSPYFYIWNTGTTDTLSVIDSIWAGIFKVTITDANGCTLVATDTVQQPESITITMTSEMTSCNDTISATGSATALPTGGNGSYSYRWNNGDMTATSINLVQGYHYVTVTDTLGCMGMDSVLVEAPPLLTFADTVTTVVSCFGGADGTATVVPLGGTPPYTYEWLTMPTQTTPSIENLATGAYRVLITDAQQCQSDTISVWVRQPSNPLTTTVRGESPTCLGGTDGLLAVAPATGGTPGYRYVWSTGDTTFNVFNVASGLYAITVTDAKNCTTVETITLEAPTPVSGVVVATPVTCYDGYDGFITVDTAYGGQGAPYAYGFNNGLAQPNPTFINLPPGDYPVTIQDAFGCAIDTIVTVGNAIELMVELGPDITLKLGDSTRLIALVNRPDSVAYTFDPPLGLSCVQCPDPMLVPTADEQIYTVTAVDSNGCIATDELTVSVRKIRNTFVPNAFTPNGDGINDRFTIYGGQGVAQIQSFRVLDRWGTVLHVATNFLPSDETFGWDGTHRGVEKQPGIYIYVVAIEFSDGKVIQYVGDVTLMR